MRCALVGNYYLALIGGLLTLLLTSPAMAGKGGVKGPRDDGGSKGASKTIQAQEDILILNANEVSSQINILNNDKPIRKNDQLSVVTLNGEPVGIWTTLTSGARAFVSRTGDLKFNPNGAYDHLLKGTSASEIFDYVVSDQRGNSATARVLVTINGTATSQNQAPMAQDDTAFVSEDMQVKIQVLDNDSDPDGDALSILNVSTAYNGNATLQEDGSIVYQPSANFNGSDSFTYTISDGKLESSAKVNISVVAVNDPPVAVSDSFTITGGETLTGSVLANDFDVDKDTLQISSFDLVSTNGCQVSMNLSGEFSYSTACGYIGFDTFRYTVSDGKGAQASTSVSVSVVDKEEMPYYVKAILEEAYRMNYPEPYGTADSVTYMFPETTPYYYDETKYGWAHTNFHAFTDEQRQRTREMLAEVSSYANIQFIEVTNIKEADITFAFAEISFRGKAVTPSSYGVGGPDNDIWLGAPYYQDPLQSGGEMYQVLMHELGHVLGFDHLSTGEVPYSESNRCYTNMSAAKCNGLAYDASTFMLFDIAAFQFIYGTNTITNAGDNTYTFDDLVYRLATIWDPGGYDTIDLSKATFSIGIDLRQGHFSRVDIRDGNRSLSIAYGTIIEEAIGGPYDDWIASNEGANRLTGGAGSDRFVFYSSWGWDTITDFKPGIDKLDFSQTGITYSELTISNSSGQTTISDGTNTIILEGVTAIGQEDLMF